MSKSFLDITGLKKFKDKIVELNQNIVEKLGNTDISKIGDGTVTGAISKLSSKIDSSSTSLNYILFDPYYCSVNSMKDMGNYSDDNIVCLNIILIVAGMTLKKQTWTYVGTIHNSKYAPITNVNGITVFGTSGQNIGLVQIRANTGDVYVYPFSADVTNGTEFRIDETYFIAE